MLNKLFPKKGKNISLRKLTKTGAAQTPTVVHDHKLNISAGKNKTTTKKKNIVFDGHVFRLSTGAHCIFTINLSINYQSHIWLFRQNMLPSVYKPSVLDNKTINMREINTPVIQNIGRGLKITCAKSSYLGTVTSSNRQNSFLMLYLPCHVYSEWEFSTLKSVGYAT